MDEQKAIEVLTVSKDIREQIPMLAPVYEVAVKALEKQIPKKPLLRMCGDCQKDCVDCDRYEDRCPNCNGGLYADSGKLYEYCPNCGQKLDWSEQEDGAE